MYAHVNTYRLGSSGEVDLELASPETISDQTARTIASWWHSLAETCRNITALSHGRPFETTELREEIAREITDDDHAAALTDWLDQLEAILA